MEVATGRVLLMRSKPVQVPDSGRAGLRLARQVELLTTDTARELGDDHGASAEDAPAFRIAPITIAITVNADSLRTPTP